jgi:PKD repeat protein
MISLNARRGFVSVMLAIVALSAAGCFFQPQPPPPEPTPVAQFFYTPAAPKPGEEVLFDGSASSAPQGATLTRYDWDFGDGASGTGAVVTHSYAQAGSYRVKLTVTDDQNRQDTAEQTVVVAAPASAEFLPLPQTIVDLQELAWDGEHFWVLDSANLKLYKLSGATGQTVKTFSLPDTAQYPSAVAWDAHNRELFVLDGNANTIYRVAPEDGSIAGQIALTEGVPLGMTWGDGYLWVSDFDVPTIYKINPRDGHVQGRLSVGLPGAALLSVGWGAGALWVYDSNHDMIYKIDISSRQKLAELRSPGATTVGLAWDGQYLWVADAELKIYKVRP